MLTTPSSQSEQALDDAHRYHDYNQWIRNHAASLFSADLPPGVTAAVRSLRTELLCCFDDQLTHLAAERSVVTPRRPWTPDERATVQRDLADLGLDVRGDTRHFDDAASLVTARCPSW